MKFNALQRLICITASTLVLSFTAVPNLAAVDERPVIEKKDDLPRHEYQISIPVVALYDADNRSVLLDLGRSTSADAADDLIRFDIRDDNTVQGFYGDLGTVALMEQRWQDYLDFLAKRRALETKEANKLTMGLVGEAVARSKLGKDPSDETFMAEFTQLVEALPFETVQDNLKSLKGQTEFLTEALVMGNLESSYQPLVDNTGGKISYDAASTLVNASFTLDHFIPRAAIINQVLSKHIAANAVEKVDIWEARKVELGADDKGSPALISVWDSGVDVSIFEKLDLLWTNQREVPDNGKDDDGNGFVDDIHGVAYDLEPKKTTDLLRPIGRDFNVKPQDLQVHAKGLGDLIANVDSDEAAQLRKVMAALPQNEVKEFLENLSLYSGYAHGTHVSGIALEGNPYARLLVARMTYNHTQMPRKPTLEEAHKDAQMFREVGKYFRDNKVRAVNMSWGGSLRGIEEALEAHNAGGSAEERKALAREIYQIGDKGLREAIGGSPNVLFITSAGNSDNDVKFDEFYPSSYEYPNLLTVGAVDIAGEETSFTSLGNVDIYANGFEVESYVPGGDRINFSGTSMASPQVLNLASKLWALDPTLSVDEVRQLILDGADDKALESRTIRLMNPAASIALLKEQQAQ
ncbi:MAG: S8 family serine peptidase [Halioglobus sp.]